MQVRGHVNRGHVNRGTSELEGLTGTGTLLSGRECRDQSSEWEGNDRNGAVTCGKGAYDQMHNRPELMGYQSCTSQYVCNISKSALYRNINHSQPMSAHCFSKDHLPFQTVYYFGYDTLFWIIELEILLHGVHRYCTLLK